MGAGPAMTSGQIALLVLAAVLVFWMLGAYNRLVALRHTISIAWAQVDEVLQRRGAAIEPLAAALRGTLLAEQGALDALLAAQARLAAAAVALREQPVRAECAQALVAAEAALAPAASRVISLAEQQRGALHDEATAPSLAALGEAVPKLVFARQRFNDAVAAYNEAVAQWPTFLLARLVGFSPAAPL